MRWLKPGEGEHLRRRGKPLDTSVFSEYGGSRINPDAGDRRDMLVQTGHYRLYFILYGVYRVVDGLKYWDLAGDYGRKRFVRSSDRLLGRIHYVLDLEGAGPSRHLPELLAEGNGHR